jgi:hypothetical protein
MVARIINFNFRSLFEYNELFKLRVMSVKNAKNDPGYRPEHTAIQNNALMTKYR